MWLCINFTLHTEHIVIADRKLHNQIKIGFGFSHQGRKILGAPGLHCPAAPPPQELKDHLCLAQLSQDWSSRSHHAHRSGHFPFSLHFSRGVEKAHSEESHVNTPAGHSAQLALLTSGQGFS